MKNNLKVTKLHSYEVDNDEKSTLYRVNGTVFNLVETNEGVHIVMGSQRVTMEIYPTIKKAVQAIENIDIALINNLIIYLSTEIFLLEYRKEKLEETVKNYSKAVLPNSFLPQKNS